MKKNFGAKAAITPLPVLIIATFNEDGSPDAMNAAWGGQCGPKHIALNLSPKHVTTENIRRTNAFTVSFADRKHLTASDYVGLVSARDEKNKLQKAGLHTEKSAFVNAPVLTDYPLTLECEVVSIRDELGETRIVGEVKNLSADEAILDENGAIDLGKMEALVYDSPAHAYRVVGERVGSAFKDGTVLK